MPFVKNIIIALLFAGLGYGITHYFEEAACRESMERARAEIAFLNQEVIRLVLGWDDSQAARDAKRISELEREADVLKKRVSKGTCFTPTDTDRLRKFFSKTRP